MNFYNDSLPCATQGLTHNLPIKPLTPAVRRTPGPGPCGTVDRDWHSGQGTRLELAHLESNLAVELISCVTFGKLLKLSKNLFPPL